MPTNTPFDDASDFVALPRLTSLRLSPDGTRLLMRVSQLADDCYRGQLWTLSTSQDQGVAQRFDTELDAGTALDFLPTGQLVLSGSKLSEPPKPDSLWLLGADGTIECELFDPPGAVSAIAVAADSGDVVVATTVLPGSRDLSEDAECRRRRDEVGTSAVLFEQFPVRQWDHDLGPGQLRLVQLSATGDSDPIDLTPTPGRSLDDQLFDVVPDGRQVVTGWASLDDRQEPRHTLVVTDRRGAHHVLAAEDEVDFKSPSVSPDGKHVVCVRSQMGTYDEPPRPQLYLIDFASGQGRVLCADLDLWPIELRWSADSTAVLFTADCKGRRPVFRAELVSDEVTQLTAEGSYREVCIGAEGVVYALQSSLSQPPVAARLNDKDARQSPILLSTPGSVVDLPGRLTEVFSQAPDGQPLRAWLAMPKDASQQEPAPLLLWVHGGPEESWNEWARWEYNPWHFVARGYAVLLPDPAMSTGYGQDFIRRGWGTWGGHPYTDLMALTDTVIAHPDIDQNRTAMVVCGAQARRLRHGDDGASGGIACRLGHRHRRRETGTECRPAGMDGTSCLIPEQHALSSRVDWSSTVRARPPNPVMFSSRAAESSRWARASMRT